MEGGTLMYSYIQRICGVCTSSHSLGCVRAVEDALGIKIPKNANYIRNIMAATLTVHDHLVHFYHLHALDWVSPLEALKADPTATANLAMAALAALVPAVGVAQVVDNTAELFEVEEVQSLEVIVVVNGTSHSVFSI